MVAMVAAFAQADPYQIPCFEPNHQTSPTVAVFCSFFNIPSVVVRK